MRLTRSIPLLLITLFLAACGALREPEAPSAPIEAIPLEMATETAAPATVTAPPQPTAATELGASVTVAQATATPTEEVPAGELLLYRIRPEESRVRFELGEDLRGVRTAVVGVTDQIAGEIAVNLGDLSRAQVGVIQINARGLATDNNFRNRAIHNEILQTGAFEFITFTPTVVNGLPVSAAVGAEVSFTVDGDLTIRNITHPVTFAVTATAVAPDRLAGTATATVNRADFDLRIPSVPSVANVDEQVRLTIDFVAGATS
jgi:polyisoprenoid-binding protein YceI